MVAGIVVVAAGDEITIAHPGDGAGRATAALILGGPLLYLMGNALFTWALWETVPWSRLVAMAALAALIPFASALSALQLCAVATVCLVALAVWDMGGERMGRDADAAPSRRYAGGDADDRGGLDG